jgi:hypothetical protein
MKKVIFLVLVAMAGVFTVQAQGGGGPQRRTVEERVKSVMERLAVLKLDKDQTAKTETIFTDAYKAQDKAREDARAGGAQPDREAMREKMQKMNDERDEKLKKVFTEDQFKKWKDEIQPAMRPQRNGGGGNN